MVECLSLKGEKIQMLKTARQEKSSWVLQMAMLFRNNSSTPNLLPKSHHPSPAWRFQEFEVCVWVLPLGLSCNFMVTRNHTDSLCWCFLHILFFFRLVHSLSFSFHFLTPNQHCTHYSEVANCAVLGHPAPQDFSPCPWSEVFAGAGFSYWTTYLS